MSLPHDLTGEEDAKFLCRTLNYQIVRIRDRHMNSVFRYVVGVLLKNIKQQRF